MSTKWSPDVKRYGERCQSEGGWSVMGEKHRWTVRLWGHKVRHQMRAGANVHWSHWGAERGLVDCWDEYAAPSVPGSPVPACACTPETRVGMKSDVICLVQHTSSVINCSIIRHNLLAQWLGKGRVYKVIWAHHSKLMTFNNFGFVVKSYLL